MRDLLLMILFAWQAITAPFFPDPAEEIGTAVQWLEQNLRHASRLTPELIGKAKSAGFIVRTQQAGGAAEQPKRKTVTDAKVARFYLISKSIASRPAWAVTNVRAVLALGADDRVLSVSIFKHRTAL